MHELKINEAKKYYGGGIDIALVVAIGGAISFFSGLIDGFIRPLRCNKMN